MNIHKAVFLTVAILGAAFAPEVASAQSLYYFDASGKKAFLTAEMVDRADAKAVASALDQAGKSWEALSAVNESAASKWRDDAIVSAYYLKRHLIRSLAKMPEAADVADVAQLAERTKEVVRQNARATAKIDALNDFMNRLEPPHRVSMGLKGSY